MNDPAWVSEQVATCPICDGPVRRNEARQLIGGTNIGGKEGAEISALHDNYSEICDTMIDGLVDASEFSNFVSSKRTVTLKLTNIPYRVSLTVFAPSISSPQPILLSSRVQRLRLCYHI